MLYYIYSTRFLLITPRHAFIESISTIRQPTPRRCAADMPDGHRSLYHAYCRIISNKAFYSDAMIFPPIPDSGVMAAIYAIRR